MAISLHYAQTVIPKNKNKKITQKTHMYYADYFTQPW